MRDWARRVIRRLKGERRHKPRLNAERVRYVNDQYAVAVRAARRLGTTPEELLDYRRADGILARGKR